MAVPRPLAEATGSVRDHGFHSLSIARVVRETPDASSFVLDVPEDLRPAFAYEAGQFCTFRVRVGDDTLLRCYSMSSAPGIDPELQVTVKRTPGGLVSNWMNDQLRTGDVVEVTRPAGVFCLAPGEGDIVAFSAGSGITPVHSLVKTVLARGNRRVRLLYANRDREAVIFASEIDALEAGHPGRFVVAHHLDAERGLLQPEAVRDFARTAGDSEFYICGPAAFMEVVEQELSAIGVGPQRIHLERFTPTEMPLTPVSPQTVEHVTRVTIELRGRTDTCEYRPGTTILQMARQMDMSPPFSCESGSCATCMARLLAGTVEMHVNNALTDDEVADGWVLTCQSVPTSASVHVVYSDEAG